MFEELVKFFIVLLVVVEPLALLPVLTGLTDGAEDSWRRHMSVKAVGISAIVCLVFAVGGMVLLDALGISVDAFKVGGGILLHGMHEFGLHGPPDWAHGLQHIVEQALGGVIGWVSYAAFSAILGLAVGLVIAGSVHIGIMLRVRVT